jgi:predicted transcriptional regulator
MKNIFSILTFVLISQYGFSQTDGQIVFEVKTQKKSIEFKKINNEKELKYLKGSFPFFMIDSTNFGKITSGTKLIEIFDKQTEVLKNSNAAVDALKSEYENVIQTQEKRVIIYQNAYNQMKSINEDLSKQLDIAIDIGRRSEKRGRLNGVIFGVLSGLVAGITLGVIVSN